MKIKKCIKQPIVVICGPTASGKTDIAIRLAKLFNGEIIGADSMQIYRHMDIGTAKPTQEELDQVFHHMINIINPDEPFNAVQYRKKAKDCIRDIHARKKTPFLVGGTGLYIKALLQGMFKSSEISSEIRTALRNRLKTEGSAVLYQELKEKDSDIANRLHPNDSHRIVRALEIFLATGTTMSKHQAKHSFKTHFYQALKLGISVPREILYERINRRVDKMISEGFLTEVKKLIRLGYNPELKPMQSIGYRHIISFLQNEIDEPTMIQQIKQETRRYAKRQITWFSADKEIHWISSENMDKMSQLIKEFLQEFKN